MTKNINPRAELGSKRIKTEEPLERLEKTYERMHDAYLKEGLSQQILIFLKKLVRCKLVSTEYKLLPLLRMMEETCKDFLLNELEATMWGIFLENAVWNDRSKPVQVLLLYSAYAAKVYMNLDDDLEAIKAYILTKYPGFFLGYDKWQHYYRDKTTVTQRFFNRCYNNFTELQGADLIDYNYYVDDLLQIAPPSGICEKESLLDFLEETDEQKLPELLTLNSIFNENDPGFPELKFCRSLSVDPNKEIEVENIESSFEGPSQLGHY